MSAAPAKQFYVYVLYRDDDRTVPFYVGKGHGRRMQKHEGAALRGDRSHKANIIRSILRDGRQVPKLYMDCDSEADAFALEIDLIALFGRADIGSNRGKELSPEHRAKLRAANRGRKISPKARAKISAARLGRKNSPETCAKISAGKRGRKLPPFSAFSQ